MRRRHKIAWSSLFVLLLASCTSLILAIGPSEEPKTIVKQIKPATLLIHPAPKSLPPKITPPTKTSSVQNVIINQQPQQPYGIAAGGGWAKLSQTQIDQNMNDLVNLGVGWVRFDISWDDVQNNGPYSYDWTRYDKIVNSAASHNIQVLAIINYTPKWARSTACSQTATCAPSDITEYSRFASVAAQRYVSKGVHSWEIWNEPNKQMYWAPNPDPVVYTGMLKSASAAIKAIDNTATVLTGGLGPISPTRNDIRPIDYLKQIYSNGGAGDFNGVSIHPYSYPVPASYGASWNAWQQVGDTPESLRSVMIANGDTEKKIWITEFGAPTSGPGIYASLDNYNLLAAPKYVTVDLQSKILTDVIEQYRSRTYYGPFFWYSYQDLSSDTSSNENFFGLIRADGSHKPAYDTYKALIKQ